MKDDAVIVLDPVNLPVIKNALAKRRQELHRRQLHRELHADGRRRAVQGRPGRVDDTHDLPGRLGRRRAAHARAAGADRHAERRGASALLDDPTTAILEIDRKVAGEAARAGGRRDRATSACRSPAACCRGSTRTWATAEPRRVEGRRRDQQDPRPGAGFGTPRCRSTASACASARCAATARR